MANECQGLVNAKGTKPDEDATADVTGHLST
jgi:hypothetical protein